MQSYPSVMPHIWATLPTGASGSPTTHVNSSELQYRLHRPGRSDSKSYLFSTSVCRFKNEENEPAAESCQPLNCRFAENTLPWLMPLFSIAGINGEPPIHFSGNDAGERCFAKTSAPGHQQMRNGLATLLRGSDEHI